MMPIYHRRLLSLSNWHFSFWSAHCSNVHPNIHFICCCCHSFLIFVIVHFWWKSSLQLKTTRSGTVVSDLWLPQLTSNTGLTMRIIKLKWKKLQFRRGRTLCLQPEQQTDRAGGSIKASDSTWASWKLKVGRKSTSSAESPSDAGGLEWL